MHSVHSSAPAPDDDTAHADQVSRVEAAAVIDDAQRRRATIRDSKPAAAGVSSNRRPGRFG